MAGDGSGAMSADEQRESRSSRPFAPLLKNAHEGDHADRAPRSAGLGLRTQVGRIHGRSRAFCVFLALPFCPWIIETTTIGSVGWGGGE